MTLGLVVLEKLFMRMRTPQSDDIKIPVIGTEKMAIKSYFIQQDIPAT